MVCLSLEQRKVVDLLPDRSAGVLEGWLRRLPAVRIIARDRYGTYIDAASRGAPSANAKTAYMRKSASVSPSGMSLGGTSRLIRCTTSHM